MQKHAQRQFFRDIHKWIKEGCPKINARHFRPDVGLCSNYRLWCDTGKKQEAEEPFHFESLHPFNSGVHQYNSEADNDTIYQNAKRLAYIKKYL